MTLKHDHGAITSISMLPGKCLQMPLNTQAHHDLIDGIYMEKFYEKVQDHLDHPDFLLSAA